MTTTTSAFATAAAIRTFATVATPVLVGALVGALLAIGTQLGWPPALRGLKVDFSRISPFTNLKQTFAPTAMMRRSGAALAKLAVVGTVVVLALSKGMSIHPTTANGLAAAASSAITRVLGLVVGAIATIAAVDYVLARRRMTAKMKMTPDEVKREMREQDGDPQLKGRRRAKMKELAKRRIAAAVAKADVVVVNPTHYAVALRYDDQQDRAPVVVAKGVDETAEKIRELARKHGVPVLERPPLARALHKLVKEGQPIPSKLYRAVAEVLAYVYRLRARTGAARGGRR